MSTTVQYIEADKDTLRCIREYFEYCGGAIAGYQKQWSKAEAALERIEEWWLDNGEPHEFEVSNSDWSAIQHYLEIVAREGDTDSEELLEDFFED